MEEEFILLLGKQSFHTGIDLVGNKDSKVLCVKEGKVTWAGWQNGYGNCVEVKHKEDNGEIFYTFYAHMQNNSICVSKGQILQEGQVVGVQGTNSTGDHLHFEIRLADKSKINPVSYLFD